MQDGNYTFDNEITPDAVCDEITGIGSDGYSRSVAELIICKSRFRMNEETGEFEHVGALQQYVSNVFTPEDFRVTIDTLEGRAVTVTFIFDSPDSPEISGLISILDNLRGLMKEYLSDMESTGTAMYPLLLLAFFPLIFKGEAGASFSQPLEYSLAPNADGKNSCVKITFLMEDAEFGPIDLSEYTPI